MTTQHTITKPNWFRGGLKSQVQYLTANGLKVTGQVKGFAIEEETRQPVIIITWTYIKEAQVDRNSNALQTVTAREWNLLEMKLLPNSEEPKPSDLTQRRTSPPDAAAPAIANEKARKH